ncbi:hypothetical protein RIN61_23475 [Pseudomonas inefficax]|nr:hypothetical protein [Pseudomonas inefficax]WNN39120.1 hypothetical protein RIN61_23475 [Pseudomonas inefficax]
MSSSRQSTGEQDGQTLCYLICGDVSWARLHELLPYARAEHDGRGEAAVA